MTTSRLLKPRLKEWKQKRTLYLHKDKSKYDNAVRKVATIAKSLRLILKHEANMERLNAIIEDITEVQVKGIFGNAISANNRQTPEQELAKVLFCKAGIELAGVQGATIVRYMGGKTIQNHIKWRKKATKMIREHLYIKEMYNEIKINYDIKKT